MQSLLQHGGGRLNDLVSSAPLHLGRLSREIPQPVQWIYLSRNRAMHFFDDVSNATGNIQKQLSRTL